MLTRRTRSELCPLSLQWINSRTLLLVDSREKLQVVDRPSQEVLETLDLEQVQLVYNSRHFKSLATGGNVSQALVREDRIRVQTHWVRGILQSSLYNDAANKNRLYLLFTCLLKSDNMKCNRTNEAHNSSNKNIFYF